MDKLGIQRRRVKQMELQSALMELETAAKEWRGQLSTFSTNDPRRYERLKMIYDEVVRIELELITDG